MPLQVYSTLTRKKELFHKQPGDQVSMYVCGPTVYKPSHIGHMVGPVIFDAVKRYLTYSGYKVSWVVNITDVDDKLIVRAKELDTSVKELAEKMTADYLDCLKKLNVTGIDQFPRATDHIPGMIAMMERLIAKGHAYAAGGDVYFDISKDDDYGKLCNRDPEQLEAGSRVEISDKKRNPGDFALWKASKAGEPAWESPWGKGRPGWHIECSVMSQALLGNTLDIHGGGLDLQFPHHENELAQSESDTGETFARVWMHNGLLKMRSGKMAGSVGNVLNVADALKHVSGDVLRFFILNTHYRSPIDLGDWEPGKAAIPSGLETAKKAYQTFYRFAERFQRITGQNFYSELHTANSITRVRAFHDKDVSDLLAKFLLHMDDDFNTGGAVSVLFELVTALNTHADETNLEQPGKATEGQRTAFHEGASVLKELGQILGLFSEGPKPASRAGDDTLATSLLQLIVDVRGNLRTEAKKIPAKDDPLKKSLFDQAGLIRDQLAKLGVTLEDRPGGTEWRIG
jgi:cysteinyl-tRNA synthetase